jgi:epoxyqueuosine reductase QueG
MNQTLIEKIRQFSIQEGACLFGTGCIKDIKSEFNFSRHEIEGLDYAISVAFRLSQKVLNQIEDYPTRLYFHHYRMVNMFLDQLALKITNILQKEGYSALPVPASQIIDWKNQRAHLSHKKVAYLCGLGWIGRNNLLVTPQYGAQVRLVTILTDLELPQPEPMEFNCGDCYACLDVCPVKAIKQNPADFDHISCYNKLDEFRRKNFVGQHICGICVKACKGKV